MAGASYGVVSAVAARSPRLFSRASEWIAGLLQTVDFTEGQTVHRGDLLAQVDPRPNQARLDETNAGMTRDEAPTAPKVPKEC